MNFELFWSVWDMVSANYLNRPVDSQKMLYGAISGMVNALGDPYTTFLPPQVNEAVTSSLNNTYQGIGAELGLKDGQLMVVAPLDGSPAKEAGIRKGDKIFEIDGTSTYGVTITEAVVKIRGDAGTIVKLKIQHEEEDPKVLEITRGVIKMDSVTWEDKGNGTIYIRVSRFGEDTNKQWDSVVKQINENAVELDAIILDLRGNPGGYMLGAVHIASDFFSEKPVLYEQTALGEDIPLDTEKRKANFEKVPSVLVLIDEGSASASEILAAALKDHIKATLVGKKSFGKGTVQEAKDFKDGSGIHITTAKWLTPTKEWVHDKGIEPDIQVDFSEDDFNNQRDPQLDKAVELAKEI